MKKTLITLLFLLLSINVVYGDDLKYRTKNIAEAVRKIGLADVVQKLPSGYTLLKKNDVKICVRINKKREMTHIGIPVFSKAQRELIPSPVYDFIEYANLSQFYKLKNSDSNLKYISFVKGKWSDLTDVEENLHVDITNIEGKYIDVVWNINKSKKVVEIKFPIMYELITNSSRKELEDNFSNDLRQVKNNIKYSIKTLKSNEINNLSLYVNKNDTIYKTAADTLFVSGISDATYYKKDNDEYKLIFDNAYNAISYRNMFLENIQSEIQNINIVLNKTDFTNDTISTTVGKLLNVLKKQGNKNFIGIRTLDSKELQFSLYSYNKDLGYIHLFIIKGVADSLCSNTLQAKGYLYIPTSNISNIYSDNLNQK